MSVIDRIRAVPGQVDARLQPLRGSLPFRAWTRYNAVRGNVLAGGVAYFAFFSIFPALAIGFTVLAVVLGNRADLQEQLVRYVNTTLGSTVISYHPGDPGLVSIDQLVRPDVLRKTGLIGVVTLLFTGLGWVSALRDGIQAVFATHERSNVVLVKLFDFLVFLATGLAVFTSAVAGIAINIATGQVLDVLGFARTDFAGWALTVLGQLLLVVLDTVIFTLLFHRLCGVSLPWGDLATGGFIAAIGFTLLKLFASELLQGVSRNRFLASFGVIVGLLVWMNLVARLLLVSAAWSATVAQDRGHLRTPDPSAQAGEDGADGEAPVADGEEPPDTARPEPVRRHRGRLALAASFAAGALASRLLSRRGNRDDAGD